MIHTIEPIAANFTGCFRRDRTPILSIESGDTVHAATLDAGWGIDPFAPDVFHKCIKGGRVDPANDTGHCLVGPIFVCGARAGQTLAVRINALTPDDVAWTWAGAGHACARGLGIESDVSLAWRIDSSRGVAINTRGHEVKIAPFLGVMGNCPGDAGIHSTTPPRRVGGNIDCRELVAGATLFLPVEVDGALFCFGDGHAAQGDGEVSGTAIECAMKRVELVIAVRDDLPLDWPQASTPAGWITFGFDRNLRAATTIALNAMLDRMCKLLAIPRPEALALASTMIDLRITQIANDVLGVHALWPKEQLKGMANLPARCARG